MNQGKKQYALYGRLLRPLTVGQPAAFLSGGKLYCTSHVVAVKSVDARCVEFETENSRYRLSLCPFPPAAVNLLPAGLAACA